MIRLRIAGLAVALLLVADIGSARAGDLTQRSDSLTGVEMISEDAVPDSPACAGRDTQVEPDVSIDPTSNQDVVAVFQEGRCTRGYFGGSLGIGYARSQDGGLTWNGSTFSDTHKTGGPFDRASDPAVAFGPDGSVYVVGIGFDTRTGCRSSVLFHASTDGGKTFGRRVLVQDDTCRAFNDKPWIAVDEYAHSPFLGRIYVVWGRQTQFSVGLDVVLRYSDDGGATWSHLIYVTPKDASGDDAIPLIEPDGHLVVVYQENFPSGPVEAQMSTDGGRIFSNASRVARIHATVPADLAALAVPSATVDPVTGTLYMAWQDGRFRTDDLNDAVIVSSDDESLTWSSPHVVNPPTDANLLTPAVAAWGGVVHVSYLYRSTNASGNGRHQISLRYVASQDGGATFGTPIRLGAPGDLTFADTTPQGQAFLGDYMGLAAGSDAVHAVWCRPFEEPRSVSKAPRHQAAWTATVLPSAE